MTTAEGKIKELVKKLFRKYGVYYHMPVMNGMGAPTLDFIACAKGYFFAVETKAPGKKPTPRQRITMDEMEQAGGFVFAVSCDDDLRTLEEYLKMLGAFTAEQLQAHLTLHS